MRALVGVGAALLAITGGGMVALYVSFALGQVAFDGELREIGVLAGAGVAFVVAALMVGLAGLRRRQGEIVRSLRMPPLWFSFLLLVASCMLGWLAVSTDRIVAFEPILALVGASAIALFFIRLASRWAPGRRAPAHAILLTTAWGMIVATSAAIVMQLAFVAASVGGIVAGLRIADVQVSGGLLETLLSEDFIADSGSELVGTATVALFVMLIYAAAAPLTEELTKFLGVAVVMRNRLLTRYSVFVAGVSVGIGFAVFETIGYALGAGSGWPLVLAVRAPVALIHVTGTSLVACGWYLQRRRGGFPLVGYFAVAVLVHAAWNGLTVAMLLISASIPTTGDPDPAAVLAILGALGMMLCLLAACLTWLIASARRWGREYHDPYSSMSPVPALAAHAPYFSVDRANAVSRSLTGEVR